MNNNNSNNYDNNDNIENNESDNEEIKNQMNIKVAPMPTSDINNNHNKNNGNNENKNEEKNNENDINQGININVNKEQQIITPITLEEFFDNYFRFEYYEEKAYNKISLKEFMDYSKHPVGIVQNATYGIVEERSPHGEIFVMCECILVLALEEAYKNFITLYLNLDKEDKIYQILFKNIKDIHNIYEVFYNNYFIEEIYQGYIPSIVNYYWMEYHKNNQTLIDGDKLKKHLKINYISCSFQWLADKCKEIFLAITSMIRDHNIYAYNNSQITLQLQYFPNVAITNSQEWLLYRAYIINQAMRLWQYDIIKDIENANAVHSAPQCKEINYIDDHNSYLYNDNDVKIRFVPILQKYNLK